MNPKIIKFLLVILVIGLVIIGGLYAYKQNFFQKGSSSPTAKKAPSNIKNSAGQPLRDSVGLPVTPATTSGKTVEDFVKTVKEDAQESSDLNIRNCLADPGVIRVKLGQKINVKNSDDKDITLSIAVGMVPTIPAKKSVSLSITAEPAIYTYGCSSSGGTSQAKSGVMDIYK
ncbi:hypothetical protein A2631_00200 [Candidatus Daviesbacteria bacterium RIFCSPHIGHO2_01_FULL_44_29]|uniref:Uncharacterized protein n=1 Tax=Candidatus Daviesbacteria bacterium RIFCSPHIGHO2_02_FULL_43_12 TaxID=1797776 RepID=A0A1F5KHX5_9BACT|nr:MAG: hypothetical protein A2631_00200 [Candidatus Daviesbacteria bacterium RIFCSPHIGHO2_01_FULL_44_29]OGE38991.1 MAG: hypothetical protein A3E86_05785 [Candidatus Daviesbacteria bacterium RIFCSPHIGHO2_12_FULL_47_45]OGE40547.1 MAG: hypothetical protein A3D25_00295 [Candidatus Daviesbacteria bacterium RIFCSPHIGHO2_02_FULL_43_12]OGE70106.1 MAG: hypothetical protein A3B55_00065 [Candidatus Daviesbacteria bacterium RIFCSPLOWO2_01_FULL_43_15]